MFKRLKELLFQNRSTKQTIIKNTFWLSVSQVGSRLIRAIIIIYAARVLGAGEYGIFSYVLGFAGFFTVFADIGVNSLLTRDTANYPEKRNEYFASAFWIKIILLLIAAILVIFAAPHFTNIQEAKILIPFVALLVIFDGIREFSIASLRGEEKMEWEAAIVILMNVTIVIAGFLILSVSHSAKSLIFSYMASVGFSALISIIILKDKFAKIFSHFNKKLSVEIIKHSWPIAFSGILGVLMLNTDTVMLGWWRTAEEIGHYSASQRIVQVLYMLPSLLASGIFPALSRLVKNNEKEKEKTLNEKSMSMVFLIALPLIIGGTILSQPLIKFIFGAEYIPAASAFSILLITLILLYPNYLLYNLIIAYNQQSKVFGYLAMGALGNVFFNFLLIPKYGIAGSAIATLISQTIYVGLIWQHVKKITIFKTFIHIKKIIASAIIMGIFSFLMGKFDFHVILNIIISGLIYAGALFLLKEKIITETKELFKKIENQPAKNNSNY